MIGSLTGVSTALATHATGPNAQNLAYSCVASHCTIIDWWNAVFPVVTKDIPSWANLHATLNMDTALRAPAQGITRDCTEGGTISIPIDAGGEIIGAGEAFWDSPPVYFQPQGIVRAIIQGIPIECRIAGVTSACTLRFADFLEGTWADTWTSTGATAGSVQCTSNAAGTEATCTIAPGTRGTINVNLKRTVDNLTWTAEEQVFQSYLKRTDFVNKPYAQLISSAQINCAAPQTPNLTVSAVSTLPTQPIHNDGISVNAAIVNPGQAVAGTSVAQVRFDQGADGSWDVGPFSQTIASLAPDQSANGTWVGAWTAPAGIHRVEVCADANNAVAETDETDNCRVVVFSVRQSALTCSPTLQTVPQNEPILLRAAGGASQTPVYRWTAPSGSSTSGEGETFTTAFTTAGTQTVGVIENYVDVNGDGSATSFDAQAVLQNVGKSEPGTGARWQNQANKYDVNGDGSATRRDAQIAHEYAEAHGSAPLPLVTCAVAVQASTTTLEPLFEPTPASLCAPDAQNAGLNEPVRFSYVLEGESRWEASGGLPPSSASTRAFSTQYAAAGTYTVQAFPSQFYDVNGDGHVTAFDYQMVAGKVTGTNGTTPALTGLAWQNQSNPFDVNGDGTVSSLDALHIINYLNRYGAGVLPRTTCTVNVANVDVPAGVGPTADFTVPDTVFVDETIPAVSTSRAGTCSSGSCSTLTQTWEVTRGSDGQVVTVPNPSSPTITLIGDTVTQYTFKLTVVDGLNRTSSATKFVQVIGRPVDLTNDRQALCAPLTHSATVNSPVQLTSTIGHTAATWSAPEGTPTSGTGASFSVSFATPGSKTVRVSAFVPPYLDVTGDGAVTFADAVAVSGNLGVTSGPGNGSAWQNQANKYDVNSDGSVSPQADILPIFNYINENGIGRLPALECQVEVQAAGTQPDGDSPTTATCPPRAPWYDVTGDGAISAADHAAVVAAVNRGAATSEAGSGGSPWQNQSNRFDVNGDGSLTPVGDVRALADYINAHGEGPLPACTVITPPPTTGGPASSPFNPGPIKETE